MITLLNVFTICLYLSFVNFIVMGTLADVAPCLFASDDAMQQDTQADRFSGVQAHKFSGKIFDAWAASSADSQAVPITKINKCSHITLHDYNMPQSCSVMCEHLFIFVISCITCGIPNLVQIRRYQKRRHKLAGVLQYNKIIPLWR